MEGALYDRPAVYDALHAEKPYDEEVAFALDRAPGARRALVVGCATGEHVGRLRDAGLEVVGVDPAPSMVRRAREKSDAHFCVGTLPDLPIDGAFDLVVVPFAATNRLAPDELPPALSALAERVGEHGTLILETGDFPEIDVPTLRTIKSPEGDCARLVQFRHLGDRRVRMDALVFHGSSWFVDRHDLTEFADGTIGVALTELGFVVERQNGYADRATRTDRTDRTTTAEPSVFVARRV